LTTAFSPVRWAFAGSSPTASIGIVGAGLAGLTCADVLKRAGVRASLYEANQRVGGRCYSLSGLFPGQVVENGGELIDTPHKTMQAYATEFNLAKEDLGKQPGDVFYYFRGLHIPEASIVDEYREFVAAMHADLRLLTNGITADNHA